MKERLMYTPPQIATCPECERPLIDSPSKLSVWLDRLVIMTCVPLIIIITLNWDILSSMPPEVLFDKLSNLLPF